MPEQIQCKWFMICPMKLYWEQGRIDSKWMGNYYFRNGKNYIRYEKEEKGIYHPVMVKQYATTRMNKR